MKLSHSFIKRWRRHLGLILAAIAAFLFAIAPVAWSQGFSANSISNQINQILSSNQFGNLVSASVDLDGYPLFKIASVASTNEEEKNDELPIKLRETAIESALNQAVQRYLSQKDLDPQNIKVTYRILNNLPVVSVSNGIQPDRGEIRIMTITQEDARLYGLEPKDLAEQIIGIIRDALIKAYNQRQNQYVIRQGLYAIAILLSTMIISWTIQRLQIRYKNQSDLLKQEQEKLNAESSIPVEAHREVPPDQQQTQIRHHNERKLKKEKELNTNRLKRLLLQILQLILWLSVMTWIVGRFPWIRWVQSWLLKQPLTIVAIIIFTSLAIRGLSVLIDRTLSVVQEAQTLSPIESQRRALRFSTFSVVLKGIATAILAAIAVVSILETLNIPTAPILAGVGVLALGVSLGAQNLVTDVINGCFILLEDQYAVGDVIDVDNAVGFVEYMNLRITQLRGAGGRLSTIPNSSIKVVHNLTKNWSRVDFTVEIAYDADPVRAMELMKETSEVMAQDPEWKAKVLEPFVLIGVENISHAGIQLIMWIKTQPIQQWNVAREFRRRLKIAFDKEGIAIGIPQQFLRVNGKLEELDDDMNGRNSQGDRALDSAEN
ncbi:MAG: mechanosensitive ion channel family protein [Jaaginema sp. PMC 1079.18]|nr:mechanosensitive ion channel family protein [Jaaginema sp. PMC 1080.18]MEC4851081.1 mechanosensitive ion channel family protein [Jaaginema sp. PMC 1079.18]MEC4865330.1 mechanosensitive ion channel family protein [Jaaginema sp. PMC 1078.18]